MVLIRAARAAISALISASICFGAVEAQDHGAASEQKQTMQGGEAQNFKIKRRYFRSCSCLHKQKSKGPARLYDEISQEQAEKSATYFIGYFKDGKLSRYEKIYEGERAFSSEDIKR